MIKAIEIDTKEKFEWMVREMQGLNEKNTNIGEKCATWNCNGEIVGYDRIFKRNEAKCNNCDREYWIVEREFVKSQEKRKMSIMDFPPSNTSPLFRNTNLDKNETKKFDTKIQSMWKISKEQEEKFIEKLPDNFSEIEIHDFFKLIRGSEYRRGKVDGIKEFVKSQKVKE